jgi:hypothetical protein
MRWIIALLLGLSFAQASAGQPKYMNYYNYVENRDVLPTYELACLRVEEVQPHYSPVDLLTALLDCAEQREWERAHDLYTLIGLLGAFDAQRVKDETTHHAGAALQLEFVNRINTRKREQFQLVADSFADVDRQRLCGAVSGFTPDHSPEYMLALRREEEGRALRRWFNADDAWKETLAEHLNCAAGLT